MNKKHLYYSSAVAFPALALLLATGVHAQTSTVDAVAKSPGEFRNMTLTDAQKEAVKQAKELHAQADAILEKAGLPARHHGMKPGMAARLQLTDEQKTALEQAKALRQEGKLNEAKAVLEKAGFPAMKKGMGGFGHRPR